MRFYSPSSGSISIDGRDIEELNMIWLRNNITCVQQNAVLFNETVKRNIAIGHRYPKHVTAEQLSESTKVAALEHTLADLEFGLDTRIGSGGVSLSGGQVQRVALARARIRNTPILILDEFTSALDQANITTVVERVRRWREGLTTIIITHDLSQIRDDDFVYVLEDGYPIEQGPKKTLRDLGFSASDTSGVEFLGSGSSSSTSSEESRPKHYRE
jgi:ATP-binding cassette, subfamily B (MDR/TAP), member 1